MNWIPVKDKLPEKNEHVLLFLRNDKGEVLQVVGALFHREEEKFATYNGEYVIVDGESIPCFLIKDYVKAWMSLPKPYIE